jgi:hypothetical protein
LHKEGLKSWLQYQSLRKLLFNGFKLSNVGHMPTPAEQHLAHIVERVEFIEIVEKTLACPWNEVAPFWEIILGANCPTLNRKFRRPTCFDSWDEFAEHLLEIIEDKFEDTHHPYWLLKILVIAEQWEVFRSNFRDGRTNDTAEKVWKLRDEKMAIQKIASAVKISRQQVSNILKKPRPVI